MLGLSFLVDFSLMKVSEVKGVNHYLEVSPLHKKLFMTHMHHSCACTQSLLPTNIGSLPFEGLTLCVGARTKPLPSITCICPQKSQVLFPRALVPRCRWPVAPPHTTELLFAPLHCRFCFLCQSFSKAALLTFGARCSLSWGSRGPVLCW